MMPNEILVKIHKYEAKIAELEKEYYHACANREILLLRAIATEANTLWSEGWLPREAIRLKALLIDYYYINKEK